MNKFIRHFCFFVVVSLVCGSLAVAQGVDVTILHVHDTHSHLDSFGPKDKNLDGTIGGIAKAAAVIGMVRATDPNVILLHAGDMFQGDFFFNTTFGVAEFQLMQQLGFDAMAVGNHEFAFGPDVLAGSLTMAFSGVPPFPLLSANTDVTDYPALKPYIVPATMVEKSGIKIGIFGMTIPNEPTENPGPVKILEDVFGIAYRTADSLRHKAGAQAVICLSHLGVAYDRAVAANVPFIDVIVGGHDHNLYDQPLQVTNPLGTVTLILQAGSYYTHVGKLGLHIENGNVSVTGYQMLDVDASVPKVAEVQAAVDGLKAVIVQQYGDVYRTVVGVAATDLNKTYDPATPVRDSQLGDLVTDACRNKTHTDIAIAAHGFINEKIYKGPIVGADIFRPLSNGYDEATGLGFKLVTVNLTGMDLITGLESSLSYLGLSDDFFLDVSGMRYRYNATRPVGSRVDLKSIRIDGRKFNPLGTYSVTVNEGIAALFALMGITPTNVQVLPDLEYNVVHHYIASLGTVASEAQGRILDIGAGSGADLAKFQPDASEETERTSASLAPNEFRLGQNYPNPFNPVTSISVAIPKESFVSLRVFNVVGQEVATLANGNVQPGTYQYRFDASRLPSGVYVYQLRAGDVVQSRKMILMK